MARLPRARCGDVIFHVLNRGNARQQLFFSEKDYAFFLRLLREAQQRIPLRILKFCLMPNHWHLLVWPSCADELSNFMHWLEVTHTQRWHRFSATVGYGHIYQGRYKAFPVETGSYLVTVAKYIERNALRAKLVGRAENWPWCSLSSAIRATPILTPFPVALPERWIDYVNDPESDQDLFALRLSVTRGRPYGSEGWTLETAARLGITQSLRPRGRPKKE